jgi:phage tail sheath gpL-like
MISTYVTNSYGTADPTLLDITTIRTLDYVRYQVLVRLQNRFQRAKLSTKTPARVVSQVLDVLYQLEALEIVQNVTTYASGVIAERDTSDVTRINVKIPTNIVSGLHVIAGVIELIL